MNEELMDQVLELAEDVVIKENKNGEIKLEIKFKEGQEEANAEIIKDFIIDIISKMKNV